MNFAIVHSYLEYFTCHFKINPCILYAVGLTANKQRNHKLTVNAISVGNTDKWPGRGVTCHNHCQSIKYLPWEPDVFLGSMLSEGPQLTCWTTLILHVPSVTVKKVESHEFLLACWSPAAFHSTPKNLFWCRGLVWSLLKKTEASASIQRSTVDTLNKKHWHFSMCKTAKKSATSLMWCEHMTLNSAWGHNR